MVTVQGYDGISSLHSALSVSRHSRISYVAFSSYTRVRACPPCAPLTLDVSFLILPRNAGRPGPPDAEYPTRAGDGSRGPDAVAGARRTRALWGASGEGEGTVAEALTRRGGGTPWEEMSELRLSSSRAP